jgi:hypothetical protein
MLAAAVGRCVVDRVDGKSHVGDSGDASVLDADIGVSDDRERPPAGRHFPGQEDLRACDPAIDFEDAYSAVAGSDQQRLRALGVRWHLRADDRDVRSWPKRALVYKQSVDTGAERAGQDRLDAAADR